MTFLETLLGLTLGLIATAFLLSWAAYKLQGTTPDDDERWRLKP